MRNNSNPTDPIPDDVLLSTKPEVLNKHLSRYIVETRKPKGDLYPPSTLYQLLCGICGHCFVKMNAQSLVAIVL